MGSEPGRKVWAAYEAAKRIQRLLDKLPPGVAQAAFRVLGAANGWLPAEEGPPEAPTCRGPAEATSR